jgi:hypothetical protein
MPYALAAEEGVVLDVLRIYVAWNPAFSLIHKGQKITD